MVKLSPTQYDFDSKVLDAFTGALELLLEAYEKDAVSIEGFVGGVRDLVILSRKVPRSVTIDMEAQK